MVHVEPVGPDEWARVRAVRLWALGDAPDAFWTTVEQERATTVAAWRARLARRDAVSLLARVDEEDVGMAVGAPHHLAADAAGLYAVWVAPRARGRAVGEALIAAVTEWARRAGHHSLLLDVGDHNASAIGLYARMGFVPTGRTTRMPPPRQHITEHERVLRLDG